MLKSLENDLHMYNDVNFVCERERDQTVHALPIDTTDATNLTSLHYVIALHIVLPTRPGVYVLLCKLRSP